MSDAAVLLEKPVKQYTFNGTIVFRSPAAVAIRQAEQAECFGCCFQQFHVACQQEPAPDTELVQEVAWLAVTLGARCKELA